MVPSNTFKAASVRAVDELPIEEVRFARDSPLEQAGFELSVPALRNEGSDARNATEDRLTLGSDAPVRPEVTVISWDRA